MRLVCSLTLHFDYQEYPWIASEKSRFGRPGTEYDFASRDPESAFNDYNEAEKQVKELGKGVNRRVSILAVSVKHLAINTVLQTVI